MYVVGAGNVRLLTLIAVQTKERRSGPITKNGQRRHHRGAHVQEAGVSGQPRDS